MNVQVGDQIRLRKKHPCGSTDWDVYRIGTDIGLICHGCGRRVMLPRGVFNKRLKTILKRANEEE